VNSQSKIDFAQLKSEIHLLERNDFAALKAENERMAAEVAKLQQKVREDINRTIAGNRLE
jgi:cell division protein FtsB